jgi:hypothetical protein
LRCAAFYAAIGCIAFRLWAEDTMKWLLTTFLALLILTGLQPWLQKLGIGRLPGDVRFKVNGKEVLLPFTSTVVLSLLLTLIARLI